MIDDYKDYEHEYNLWIIDGCYSSLHSLVDAVYSFPYPSLYYLYDYSLITHSLIHSFTQSLNHSFTHSRVVDRRSSVGPLPSSTIGRRNSVGSLGQLSSLPTTTSSSSSSMLPPPSLPLPPPSVFPIPSSTSLFSDDRPSLQDNSPLAGSSLHLLARQHSLQPVKIGPGLHGFPPAPSSLSTSPTHTGSHAVGMGGLGGLDGKLSGSPIGDGMEARSISASPILEMTFGRNG